VPDGVTMRTWDAPPALSTPWAVVTIENSLTLSDVGRFGTKSTELVRMKLSWMLIPSCVTWVQVGRPPLMAVLVRPRLATPACNWTSEIGLRPLSGSDTICCCSTVVVTSGDVVGTSDEPASTVMFSLTFPSWRRAVSAYS
jgi:hypothetical protein